jgi:histidine ammonia-lyase
MIQLDGHSLTINDIYQVAANNEPVGIATQAKETISQSRKWVEDIIQSGKPVYGINTGFGVFANQKISKQETKELNRNLILSHAVGTGPPLSNDIVRAAMVIRANTFAKGFSGVRLELVEILVDMLNKGVTPVIPSQGSLGSSGDLLPLSHLGLVLSTDDQDDENCSGYAEFQEKIISGKKAMKKAGIPRLILEGKEGLALNNGATFSAAMASLICHEAEKLLSTAEIALAMCLEALLGISSAFDSRIHESRQHPGQIKVAERIRTLTAGSTLLDSTDRVQDAYSLRCGPQVHGPAWDTLEFSKGVITREINAATDNPLLFGDGVAISGGNFHGESIGLVMDFLGIALTEISGISERRTYRLIDGNLNENLPSMLVDTHRDAGLNSGVMMPQYTAASLVLENRSLATPDSTNSLPTSAAQEDHNANSMTAARHTWQILHNTAHVLAIELYTAARALDLRNRNMPEAIFGKGTRAAYQCIRDSVPYQPGDALWGPEIETVSSLVSSGKIVSEVEKELQTD